MLCVIGRLRNRDGGFSSKYWGLTFLIALSIPDILSCGVCNSFFFRLLVFQQFFIPDILSCGRIFSSFLVCLSSDYFFSCLGPGLERKYTRAHVLSLLTCAGDFPMSRSGKIWIWINLPPAKKIWNILFRQMTDQQLPLVYSRCQEIHVWVFSVISSFFVPLNFCTLACEHTLLICSLIW